MQDLLFFISNNLMLFSAWVIVILLYVAVEIKERMFGPKRLSVNEVVSMLNKEEAKLLDIRPSKEFNDGHITNAENFSFSEVNNTDVLLNKVNSNQDQSLILVCSDGLKSKQEAFSLQRKGILKVFYLNNGMQGWKSEGLPTIN